jgi:hypothetical protein
MQKLLAIVIFAGAVLISTRILAPAASPRPLPPLSAADLAGFAQTTAMVDQVNAQVDRLRERLATPPSYPAPTRDPFRFGTKAEPAPKAPAPAPRPAPAVVAAPAISMPPLPRLVAIVSNNTDAGPSQRAVVAAGEDVQILKIGDMVSRFVVRSIGVDSVELADSASGATFKISLQ